MDIQTIMQWIQLGTDHKYLALAIVVIGYLTSLTSDWSKFPITVPSRFQPLIAATLGLVYGVLNNIQAGTSWYKALTTGLLVGLATGGLYDVVINAVFNGKVPSWLRVLSFGKPVNDNAAPQEKKTG